MPNMTMKEAKKLIKDCPGNPAAQSIKEQLGETTPITTNINNSLNLKAKPAQKRSGASDLAGEINKLHKEVLHGFIDICQKAIMIALQINYI